MKNSKLVVIVAVIIIVVFLGYGTFSGEESTNKQEVSVLNAEDQNVTVSKTNSEGAVTITVVPKNISASAQSWDFEVELNTHSVELDYDLTQISVLLDDENNESQPIRWEGDPPGGHHRKGTLSFKPIVPIPQEIQLKINGVGNVPERIFSW